MVERLEKRADGPPECAQVGLGGDVLDYRDCRAHRRCAGGAAAQPFEQAVLVIAPFLQQLRSQARRRHDFARRRARRAHVEVGVEQVRGRRCRDAPQLLHRLVIGKELERHRGRATGDLIQEHLQPAAGAIDALDPRRRIDHRKLVDPGQQAFDLVGVRDDRVEADHLDRACRLVDVRARVLQRSGVGEVRAEGRERVEPRASAWSISAWTHDSGPRSNSRAVSVDTARALPE